jgi:hypothetical protein
LLLTKKTYERLLIDIREGVLLKGAKLKILINVVIGHQKPQNCDRGFVPRLKMIVQDIFQQLAKYLVNVQMSMLLSQT